ncbi:MAG: AhpC/TSA family protein [Chitinophagaceae bacterium]|nr:AhpC/TSA family protein [Chitinophagaceae bacterium]
MIRLIPVLFLLSLLTACKNDKGAKRFVVKGKITNNTARMIYLEEVPMATMQASAVDSAEIGKDGSYSLKAVAGEARVYNLRLDQNMYPIAAVINDVSSLTLNAVFSKENNQFVESYEVKGSENSQQLKDFMTGFNTRLQGIFELGRQADSLRKLQAADSLYAPLNTKGLAIATELKTFAEKAIKESKNPALTMLILGYYQSSANNQGLGLLPVSNEEVTKLVNELAASHPSHKGLAGIKAMLDKQNNPHARLVGQTAPEIALPDPNGKEIKLSSFRGKYVLVDFWASWCVPCRQENPNVVNAYQKFKNKNFTILGVSLDRPGQKEAWLKAIKDDQLTWSHISDLQFWNSAVVPLYGIEGIPYNVLIDPEGKIIAESLRGAALEAKLSELLP